MNRPPYVISGDLEVRGPDQVGPDNLTAFRESLAQDLGNMGKEVVLISGIELRTGLGNLARTTNLPIIGLDRHYVIGADDYLDISRAVKPKPPHGRTGHDARIGTSPLRQQLDGLGCKYAGEEVVLADDVLFGGGTAAMVLHELGERGVQVSALFCGIAVGQGEERLAARGIGTLSVRRFPRVENVLCERDATVLPGSGRKVVGQPRHVLYFDDHSGRSREWASIAPERIADFCLASLLRNQQLLQPDMPLPAFVGYPDGLTTGEALSAAINERTLKDTP